MQVVFSDRAMAALLVETREKVSTETGGVFLGVKRGDMWYIVECIDPGPNSIFEPAYFEYDLEYINHLINKISRLYETQLDLIGLWHRHPGSFDSFSKTDDATNQKYAELSEDGAISGIVNLDPDFRLTLYHVMQPYEYDKMEYAIGDQYIPNEVLALKSREELELLLVKESRFLGLLNRKIEKSHFSGKLVNTVINDFGDVIHRFLKRRTMTYVRAIKMEEFADASLIDDVIEMLYPDLEYLEKHGVSFDVKVLENGKLNLSGYGKGKLPWCLIFGKCRGKNMVVFQYNEVVYKYRVGLFGDACKEYLNAKRKGNVE